MHSPTITTFRLNIRIRRVKSICATEPGAFSEIFPHPVWALYFLIWFLSFRPLYLHLASAEETPCRSWWLSGPDQCEQETYWLEYEQTTEREKYGHTCTEAVPSFVRNFRPEHESERSLLFLLRWLLFSPCGVAFLRGLWCMKTYENWYRSQKWWKLQNFTAIAPGLGQRAL